MADAPQLAQLARDLGWEVDPTGGPQGAVLARTDGRELFLRPEPTGGVTLEAPVRRVSSPPPGALYPLLVRWASPRPGIKAITCPAADGTTVVVRREGVSALRDALSTSAAGLVVERDALEAELQRDEPTWSRSPRLAHRTSGRVGPASAGARPPSGRLAPARGSDRFAPVGDTDGADRRPCPRCGESIKKVAVKCRHCGEVFDPTLRARRATAGGYPLGGRLERLAAQAIDFGFLLVPALAVICALLLVLFNPYAPPKTGDEMAARVVPMVIGILAFLLGVQCYQWFMISRVGATVGKAWLKLRILSADDDGLVDFVTGVVRRNWVMSLVGRIPTLGFFISLTDILLIFTEDRRCLHDRIAGTKVVSIAERFAPCDSCGRSVRVNLRGACAACGEVLVSAGDARLDAAAAHYLYLGQRMLLWSAIVGGMALGGFLVRFGLAGRVLTATIPGCLLLFVGGVVSLRLLANRYL